VHARSLVLALAAAAAVSACGVSVPLSAPADAPSATPTRRPASAQRTRPPMPPSPDTRPDKPDRPRLRLDTWRVGASPLPLRPDGYGRALPTPPELRVRRLPTVDRLPRPRGRAFESSVDAVSPRVRRRMGRTWTPRCPVGLDDLRYVRVSFWGFDRRPHTGEMVLHERVARDVIGVFARLHRARFPLEQMRLVTTADLRARPTGDGNNTAAFVCRPVRGGGEWSAHAYGLAVDVNPFHNPYHDGDLVLPELAGAYLDRGRHRPGMIHRDGVVVDAFAAIGWTWGGTFDSVSDPMHFSATGG
jgi:D-alanyl-D-alanine carboxypeptidase